MSRSPQEALIHDISRFVLGRQALFFPDRYGKNSEEPADLAWIVNRCAILFYMTEGKKRFERKFNHNLAQLAKWLRVWKSGTPLCGATGADRYQIAFADVDHVVGLSIVDGADVWCQYHLDHIRKLAELKLSACATITGSVMRELAAAAAGPRDLVNCIASIHDRGGERISESEILEALRSDFVNETRSRGEVFGSVSRPSKYHRNAIEDTARTFSAIKAQGIGDDRVAGISADLRSVDILWFAIASAALQSQIADPGKTGPLYMYAFQEAGIYRLQCLTAAHTGILKDNLNVITEFKSGLSLLTAFDQGKGAPVRMIALSPRAGLSLLEQELTALRTRSLAYPGLPAAPRC